jgi:two-component system, NarL family, response regulator
LTHSLNLIRILIADDHPAMREGLAALLEQQPDFEVVALARDGKEAITLYRQHQPDVLLLDLSMPNMDGTEVTAAVRTEFAHARIMILTTYDGDEDIYRALRAGACGYLLKDVPSQEIFTGIRNVYAGQKYLMSQVAYKLTDRFQGSELTERELEVLMLMVQGKSNCEISVDLNVVEGTVKFHVRNILQKLGVSDRTQAVIVALKRGFFRF